MKKIIVLLLSVVLLISLMPHSAFADNQNSIFKLSNNGYRFEKYWNVGDFYIIEAASYNEEYDNGNTKADTLLLKSDLPYSTGDDEDETAILNLTEIARSIKTEYDSGCIAPSNVLSDGHILYAVVNVSKAPTEDYVGDYDNIIVKVDIDNLSHSVFELKDQMGSMIELVKIYNDKVYFVANQNQLYSLDSDGKTTKIASSFGIVSESQSDSRSKLVYGYKPNGYLGTLKIFDLAKKQTTKKIGGVRGYHAEANKLFYAKTEKSVFKIYESKAGGSNPKLVYKLKIKPGVESSLTKADSKYIYYCTIDTNNNYARSYFRYNRNTKKRTKISYVKYAEATFDYVEGILLIEDYYRDLLAEDGEGVE